jgi:hypothetical protein
MALAEGQRRVSEVARALSAKPQRLRERRGQAALPKADTLPR